MRYLEQCLSDLKTAHLSRRDSPASVVSALPPPPIRRAPSDDENDEEEQHQNEKMEDVVSSQYAECPSITSRYSFATTASPAIEPSDRSVYSHSTTTSPAIKPHDVARYSANPSPALLPSDPHHYTLAGSSARPTVTSQTIHPSPIFGAQTPFAAHFTNPFHNAPPSAGPVPASGSSHGSVHFQLISPVLLPQPDREDQEATAALLMLNTDRRSWSGARGMSVKDLLIG